MKKITSRRRHPTIVFSRACLFVSSNTENDYTFIDMKLSGEIEDGCGIVQLIFGPNWSNINAVGLKKRR